MTDREKTIAEIRKALEKATPGPWEWQRKNFDETNAEGGYDVYDLMHWKNQGKPRSGIAVLTAFNDKRGYPVISAFLYQDALIISNAPEWLRFLLSELERKDEENRKLREELDQQRAQTEFYKGEANLRYEWYWEQNKQLQFAQKDKEKLIEGLRWYAEGWIDSRDDGQRARDILAKYAIEGGTRP